jgi:uncharacterized protein
MSTQARTDAVSPHELARMRGLFTGEIPIAAFPRLGSLVLGGGGVTIRLAFHHDDEGRCRVQGDSKVTLELQCHRCLVPVQHTLNVEIDLCVVASDAQADALTDALEPFVLEEEAVAIVDLVEDDLLLSLPAQVCPAYADCPNRPALDYPVAAGVQADPMEGKRSPFGVLADLKNRSN